MLEVDKQQAVLTLYQQGHGKKRIARILQIDPKTVRAVIAAGHVREQAASRRDKITVDLQLLQQVYQRCEGYIQRVHEVLQEEEGARIGYSTLSRLLREHGISTPAKERSCHIEDIPGEEMQHDTSSFTVTLNGKKQTVICSGLYLRYSKMRYIKFYRRFNRFDMKCFLHEALTFWGYCARTCIIDNTSLAVWYGSGSRAVFSPEMVAFAKNYGFTWYAHEISHANRKAGKERNFNTVNTNFVPGRSFTSLDDINRQAFAWATQRYAQRPQSKTGLIPARLFENEQPHLVTLPPFIQPPYQAHHRIIDTYGYVAFKANFYWVPKTHTRKVTVLHYPDHIRISNGKHMPVRYQLPDDQVRLKSFSPPDMPHRRGQPNNLKKGCKQEERFLREMHETVNRYIDFIQSKESTVTLRPRFIRTLYLLAKKTVPALFVKICGRALAYRVCDITIITNIAAQLLTETNQSSPSLSNEENEFIHRQSYREGRFVQENPLTAAEDEGVE
jgi:transposase